MVIVYRSDAAFPELGNFSVHLGGSLRPRHLRAGRVRVRVRSSAFEADPEKEEAGLSKEEADFRGRDFDKSFACVFKVSALRLAHSDRPAGVDWAVRVWRLIGECSCLPQQLPAPKGVFGKVVVERCLPGGRFEAVFEFNLMRVSWRAMPY